MRRAAILFMTLAAACSSFGGSESGGLATDGGADAAADTAVPASAPTFVGSRSGTFASSPITVLSPSGVRTDDVLVAAWRGDAGTDPRFPSDWIEVGRSSIGEQFNGGLTTLVVGYHVLSATENADTTYTFAGAPGHVATIAYRNASRQQPLAPAKVTSIEAQVLDGGSAAVDVPPMITRSVSVPLHVFAVRESTTTYPVVPGLDLVETTSSLAVYRAPIASLADVTVAGPRLEITVGGQTPRVLVASLAVAVGP